jgi:hypothetical protein
MFLVLVHRTTRHEIRQPVSAQSLTIHVHALMGMDGGQTRSVGGLGFLLGLALRLALHKA